MRKEERGVNESSAPPRENSSRSIAGHSVIQFGIFCCAVTMVIALAVALAAS